MASALYPAFKEAILNKEHDLNTDTIKAAMVTDAYTSGDTTIANCTVLDTAVTLAGTSITSGVFDTTDASTTFTAATTGSTIVGIVIYNSSASDKLIAFIDITDTPTNGGDIVITWDNGASKIFAL
jgi:hypothetical protein